jgi:hypothetical protein
MPTSARSKWRSRSLPRGADSRRASRSFLSSSTRTLDQVSSARQASERPSSAQCVGIINFPPPRKRVGSIVCRGRPSPRTVPPALEPYTWAESPAVASLPNRANSWPAAARFRRSLRSRDHVRGEQEGTLRAPPRRRRSCDCRSSRAQVAQIFSRSLASPQRADWSLRLSCSPAEEALHRRAMKRSHTASPNRKIRRHRQQPRAPVSQRPRPALLRLLPRRHPRPIRPPRRATTRGWRRTR